MSSCTDKSIQPSHTGELPEHYKKVEIAVSSVIVNENSGILGHIYICYIIIGNIFILIALLCHKVTILRKLHQIKT